MNAPRAQERRLRRVAFSLAGVSLAMLGLAYAAVPLYDLFCRATGFGGTTQVATAAPTRQGERSFVVRFDANVAPGLDWRFEPETNEARVRVGQTVTMFYKARNAGAREATGIASYNVSPDVMGGWFNKISCFCFTEQTLGAGESLDMPVVFFIDPAIEQDATAAGVKTLTLSYTFFPARERKSGAALETGGSARKL